MNIAPFPMREQFPSGLTEARDTWYRETAAALSGAAVDTLVALMRSGPLYDGDVPSKSGRDELLDCGLAAKIVVSGRAMPDACYRYVTPPPLLDPDDYRKGYSDGYQAATYRGNAVYRELLASGRVKP